MLKSYQVPFLTIIIWNEKSTTKKSANNMEAKQGATKQPLGHWRNQSGNEKIPGNNENETQWPRICGTQQKHF